jgi:hypothetical protein
MKKLLFTLLLCVFTQNVVISNNTSTEITTTLGGIEDGWYAATVRYSNYSTGTYATYKLNVKVKYEKVVTIMRDTFIVADTFITIEITTAQ